MSKFKLRPTLPVLITLGIAALLVGIDRLTKRLAVINIFENELIPMNSVPIIKIGSRELINFTYCENTGAAFSILQGKQAFLITITTVFLICAILVLLSGKIKSKMMLASIGLIIAGGIGNLIDRVFQGYVVDFIELRFINFAVFNFADMCAVVGAIMLFVLIVGEEIRDYRAHRACEQEEHLKIEIENE